MASKTMVPQSESQFDHWVRNFVRTLTDYRKNYRINDADVKDLNRMLKA